MDEVVGEMVEAFFDSNEEVGFEEEWCKRMEDDVDIETVDIFDNIHL